MSHNVIYYIHMLYEIVQLWGCIWKDQCD